MFNGLVFETDFVHKKRTYNKVCPQSKVLPLQVHTIELGHYFLFNVNSWQKLFRVFLMDKFNYKILKLSLYLTQNSWGSFHSTILCSS